MTCESVIEEMSKVTQQWLLGGRGLISQPCNIRTQISKDKLNFIDIIQYIKKYPFCMFWPDYINFLVVTVMNISQC